MAKSSRASALKKNNQALKRKVFGPAEQARNERLSAKLLELAKQPKPLRAEMEVEEEDSNKSSESEPKPLSDESMDVEGSATNKTKEPLSITAQKKQKAAKSARIEKKKHRKPRNTMTFSNYHTKRSSKGSKR